MITKDNNLKVMEVFFRKPYGKFHIRELARITGLSSTGILKIVKRLKEEKLLVTKKSPPIEEVSPDFNGRFIMMKRLYNIYSMYEYGFIDMIKKYFEMPQAIILFGSYAEGLDTENSDIDIAVISNKKTLPEIVKFEKILARNINIHVLDINKTSKEFKNSIANGITLEGFSEIA